MCRLVVPRLAERLRQYRLMHCSALLAFEGQELVSKHLGSAVWLDKATINAKV